MSKTTFTSGGYPTCPPLDEVRRFAEKEVYLDAAHQQKMEKQRGMVAVSHRQAVLNAGTHDETIVPVTMVISSQQIGDAIMENVEEAFADPILY